MKHKKIYRLSTSCILFIISWASLHAQVYTDSIFRIAGKGQEINLNLLWFSINHGDIQWQSSSDGTTWSDIQEAATEDYLFTAQSSSFFRAEISSGTCDPVYSKITRLEVADITTVSVDSVTAQQARISCVVNAGDFDIIEQGVAYDTRPYPGETSYLEPDTTGDAVFSLKLDSLETGVTYYARVYIRTADGLFIPGNVLSFSTLSITLDDRINIASRSARLFYAISSTPEPGEHGILYSTVPEPDSSSASVAGEAADGGFSAELTALDPVTTYYAVAYMIRDGMYHYSDVKTFRTFTDYSTYPVDNGPFEKANQIVWNDPSTARKISQDGYYSEYGRVIRLGTSDSLLLVYHGGPNTGDWVNICLRRSVDNGETWTPQEILMNINDYSTDFWRFCNPELIELDNGWILLPYTANGKPETNDNCYVHILTSKDRGQTWEGPNAIVTGRSWEPSIVQLPGGELEMFYSSEAKWWPVAEVERYQEIHAIRSTDRGLTWSYPTIAAYYPEKRDGMPVPVLLQGNRGVAFIIETVLHWRSPYIVHRELAGEWDLPDPILDEGDTRWAVTGFTGHGGAPYMIQLPTGETLISFHVYRGGDWKQSNMHVMIGDNDARNFGELTTPWGNLPVDQGAILSSIFLKDDSTVVLVTSRNQAGGGSAIYWLEGTIVPN
ncbi:MAG TPA: exo-alpha-sialidase [Bacteroides sp.]|nr:exo-alpha-sialidase [Bacteroides sp.]